MNAPKSKTTNNAYLFLFDGYAEGVRQSALSTFTEALFKAISAADPNGLLRAELRGGVSLVSDFSQQISQVSRGPHQSGHTLTHDMALYRLLLWDMADSLSVGHGSPHILRILNVLRLRHEECLALSNVPDQVRAICDRELQKCPGYIGSCPIDPGNPIQRRSFYDGLCHLAVIDSGTVYQQRTPDGDEFALEGASSFLPNGLCWINCNYAPVPKDLRLETSVLSARGAISMDRFKRRMSTSPQGQIFRALLNASWSDRSGKSFQFSALESNHDILEAVLPEGKFTGYLFNRDHEQGGPKARFIIDELGFQPHDWRYLAAQLYDGLLLSEPHDLSVKDWEGGYGARFNNLVEVTSRAGRKGILRTGWMLEPQKLPRLLTAVPVHSDVGVVRPPAPPVLDTKDTVDNFWEELFLLADRFSSAACQTVIPTPMLLDDFGVIEEGECGNASVIVTNSRSAFAHWLLKNDRAARDHKRRVVIPCNVASQSMERATAYALTFARVLALNGVASQYESHLG